MQMTHFVSDELPEMATKHRLNLPSTLLWKRSRRMNCIVQTMVSLPAEWHSNVAVRNKYVVSYTKMKDSWDGWIWSCNNYVGWLLPGFIFLPKQDTPTLRSTCQGTKLNYRIAEMTHFHGTFRIINELASFSRRTIAWYGSSYWKLRSSILFAFTQNIPEHHAGCNARIIIFWKSCIGDSGGMEMGGVSVIAYSHLVS